MLINILESRFRYRWGIVFAVLLMFSISCQKSGLIDPIDTDVEEVVKIMSFSSDRAKVGAGGETAYLSLTLVDEDDNPYQGGIVEFFSNKASVTSLDTTDSDGVSQITYLSGDATGIDTVTAVVTNVGSGSIEKKLYITIDTRTFIQITSGAVELLGDGVQETDLTIYYHDHTGSAISGQSISLFSELGTVKSNVVTDIQGKAIASFKVPATAVDDTAHVLAFISGAPKISANTGIIENDFDVNSKMENDEERIVESNKYNVLFKTSKTEILTENDTVKIGIVGVQLQLNADPDSLSITETTTSTISARLVTTRGEALISKTISFSTNFGTLSQNSSITDKDGYATVQLQSASASGVATITASYLQGLSSSVFVSFLSGITQAKISISANPTQILADGTSSATINVILTDSRNNPIKGALVNLSATKGRITATATTDVNGIATAELFSDRTNGVSVVSAQFGDVSKTTQVSFSGVQLSVTAQPDNIVADNN
ncbi:Ig-like domain-containing protein, partial [candidate division KSB1 bacterium]